MPGLANTDALPVAQALLDPESQKFVTKDSLLAGSDSLARLEREMREDGERSRRLKFDYRL